jgi:pimeloyl-ACP methyl ester carboxylesterase
MRHKICFVHGLNSSRRSFNYLAQELEHNGNILIDYDSRQRLESSVTQVLKFIPKTEPVVLVGHSLGGVIAMLIAIRGLVNVERVVTISSPLAGSKAAVYARWVVSGIPLIGDIVPNAPCIKELAVCKPTFPVLSIFSTGGSLPTSNEPNDSVVSVASQKALPSAKKVEVKANHFEVLMHEKTVEQVRKFLITNG